MGKNRSREKQHAFPGFVAENIVNKIIGNKIYNLIVLSRGKEWKN
jgi:hypothetical protein